MARTLQELQKQYNSASHGESLRGGGPGHRGARRASGKPKNLSATIKRLLSYVGKYKFRLITVFVCMILTTLASLAGGYLIVPIINRITLAVDPTAELNPSAIAKFADKIIEALVDTRFVSSLMGSTARDVTV